MTTGKRQSWGADGSGQTTNDEQRATQRGIMRTVRPSKGVVAESGTMGPFCKVNNSRKAEWPAIRNTFCLMGCNPSFMAKFHPAKNRPPSRHS